MTRIAIATLFLSVAGCKFSPHQASVQFRIDPDAGHLNEVDLSYTIRFEK